MSENTTTGQHAGPEPEPRPEASTGDQEVEQAAVTGDRVTRWRTEAMNIRAGLADQTRARPRETDQ